MNAANSFRSRVLLVLFGCCLLVMLASSLWHRFTNPGLASLLPHEMETGESIKNNSETMNAIGALMRQVSEKPDDLNAILRLAEGLIAVGEWKSAENFAQKALDLTPAENPNPRALYIMAIIHHNLGRNEQAAELLEKYLSRTEDPNGRYSLGILYMHYLKQPQKGIEQFEKGINDIKGESALKKAMLEELEKARKKKPQVQENNTTPSAPVLS